MDSKRIQKFEEYRKLKEEWKAVVMNSKAGVLDYIGTIRRVLGNELDFQRVVEVKKGQAGMKAAYLKAAVTDLKDMEEVFVRCQQDWELRHEIAAADQQYLSRWMERLMIKPCYQAFIRDQLLARLVNQVDLAMVGADYWVKDEEVEAFVARMKALEKQIQSMKEWVVEEYKDKVMATVCRFTSQQEGRDDLYQEGLIGLLKAIEKYEMRDQVEFYTYAKNVVEDAIRTSRERMKVVREPMYRSQRRRDIHKGKYGTGVEVTERNKYQAISIESLNDPVEEGSVIEKQDLLEGGLSCGQSDKHALEEVKKMLGWMLADIHQDERRLIINRFCGVMTLEQLGNQLSCTKEAVRQKIERILLKLRKSPWCEELQAWCSCPTQL